MTADLFDPARPEHPVRRGLRSVAEALGDVSALPVELMETDDKADVLLEVARVEAQLAAFKLTVVEASDDVAGRDGARDVGTWLAHRTRTDHGPQRRDLRLAQALHCRWARVAQAFAAGSVNQSQAEVIVAALDALDVASLTPEVVERAEQQLIEWAAKFAPKQLRVLGRRILDVVAPEIGERHEARALELEEQRAQEAITLSLRPLGNGSTRIEGVVPDAAAHRLRTYLEAFTSPRKEQGAAGDRLPSYRARGLAFCSLLEAIDPDRLPLHGGDATTVFVTVTLDALRSELATAGLISADDDRISASEARRLACTASVIPVVLGGKSEILDLGRSARLFSPAQRKALRLRDKRCRAEGCTTDAAWTEAHHRDPWAAGGATDLDLGVLLCNFHHHRIHDHRYEAVDLPGGDIRFHRRT